MNPYHPVSRHIAEHLANKLVLGKRSSRARATRDKTKDAKTFETFFFLLRIRDAMNEAGGAKQNYS